MDELLKGLVAEHRGTLELVLEFTKTIDTLPDGMKMTLGSVLTSRQLTAGDFKCLRRLAEEALDAVDRPYRGDRI